MNTEQKNQTRNTELENSHHPEQCGMTCGVHRVVAGNR